MLAIPKIRATENIPPNKKVLFEKYVRGHLNWFVAEKEGDACFGYIQNLADPTLSEWGYFSLRELTKVGAKKDEGFKPTKQVDLKEPVLRLFDVILVIKQP